jgi:hypothetical protein
MARFAAGWRQIISEQFAWGGNPLGGLRMAWSGVRRTFWPGRPVYDNTKVNYEIARQLYRNDGNDSNLGAGFCRPIIDLTVEFMGMPRASTGDEIYDDHINDCIETYWGDSLQQMIRNACRDSHTIVRIRRKDMKSNVLVEREESEACFFEIYEPERVAIYYDERDAEVIDRAYITHTIEMIDEDEEDRLERGTRGVSILPRVREHVIIEEITRELFRYYDQTEGAYKDEWEEPNTWGFVPLREVFNEFDSALSGGQSDLEGPYPFIRAFHDVLGQALAAHKYHSVPKVQLKINEIQTFLMNNFPDSFETDASGQPVPGTFNGNVSWKGLEILFFQAEEGGAEFLEAKSVLGDSKTLLEFLLDCICISSETPEWAFMRVEGATAGRETSQMLPFIKKIERKRLNYKADFQHLFKMALKITGLSPITMKLSWEEITVQDFVTRMQGLQQMFMALELALQRKLISDRTAQETIRPFLPAMKSPEEESKDAEDNFDPMLEAPNSVDPSQNGKVQDPVPVGSGGANE